MRRGVFNSSENSSYVNPDILDNTSNTIFAFTVPSVPFSANGATYTATNVICAAITVIRRL